MNRAVVMRATGPPEVLQVEHLPLAGVGASEIRIRMIAAAVNHTDLEIRAGEWPIQRESPFPYVPGAEVVGEVVETGAAADAVRTGERVVTMMQGLGGVRALHPGGYQEYVTVDADAVAAIPETVDPLAVAALGLASVTAQQGFEALGRLEGQRIAVTGAAGGVGSAAVSLAAAKGAEVIAVVRNAAQAAPLIDLGAAEIVDDVAAIPARSLDGVLDTVAGALVRPVTLTGYSSESLDGPALRRAMTEIFALRQAKRLTPPPWRTLPLDQAADAHRLLEQGGAKGRILLVP